MASATPLFHLGPGVRRDERIKIKKLRLHPTGGWDFRQADLPKVGEGWIAGSPFSTQISLAQRLDDEPIERVDGDRRFH